MRLITTLAALPVLFAAAPAIAQDTVERAPFTGPHAEVLIGWDSLQGGDDGTDDSADGLGYGVAAGFDFQMGQFIAGIEGMRCVSVISFSAAATAAGRAARSVKSLAALTAARRICRST